MLGSTISEIIYDVVLVLCETDCGGGLDYIKSQLSAAIEAHELTMDITHDEWTWMLQEILFRLEDRKMLATVLCR